MFFRDYTLAFLPVMPTWQDMTQDGVRPRPFLVTSLAPSTRNTPD